MAVGRLSRACAVEVDDTLATMIEVPREAHGLVLSMDRVSIPIEEPRPRAVGRPRKNAPKRPVARVFRMAYCAALTLCDKSGEALRTIRYGGVPGEGGEMLRDRMIADRQREEVHRR